MSITTLILALAPTIFRPKPEPEKSDREVELEKRVKELEGEVDRLLSLNERAAGRIRELEARGYERSAEELHRIRAQHAAYQQMAAQQAPHANPYYQAQQLAYQGLASQQGMLGMQANHFALGELVDCTGGGRTRHLVGMLLGPRAGA